MKCIVCGNDLPESVMTCPVCGAAAPANMPSYGNYGASPEPQAQPPVQPSFFQPVQETGNQPPVQPSFFQPVQEMQQTGTEQMPGQPLYVSPDDYDPYAGIQASAKNPAAEKGDIREGSTGKGLIIGIAAGAAVLTGLLICFLLGLFHFRNGTYIWDDYAFDGTTLQLEVSGDTGVMTAQYRGKTDVENITLDFDGSSVILSANGKYIEGTYNRKRQTISIPDDSLQGFEIVLKKQ